MLQGGGALGAYQAGVYEALAATDYEPNWIAGVSIGAVNAALIAGNPPERRVARLREFWERVSSGMSYLAPTFEEHRAAFNQFSALYSATVGVPGFYGPRPPDFWSLTGSDTRTSIYDTAPLRDTLLGLIDFDLINSKKMRLSVGAVSVTTGNSIYFDNLTHTIGPEHVMASGALPPAFSGGRDRRPFLLGWRHRLEYAAAVRARHPWRCRPASAVSRSVLGSRRPANHPTGGDGASKGYPVLESDPVQHRHGSQGAKHPAGCA